MFDCVCFHCDLPSFMFVCLCARVVVLVVCCFVGRILYCWLSAFMYGMLHFECVIVSLFYGFCF